jgi:hypothetical protein
MQHLAEEWKLGRGSKQGKMLSSITRYWDGILQVKQDKLLKHCCEWQAGIPK